MNLSIPRSMYCLLSGTLPALLILFSCSAAANGATQVFDGKVGTLPIVMELDLSQPNQVNGRYFYRKYHLDIPLSGKLTQHTLTLVEGFDDQDKQPAPTLILHKQDNGWVGEWRHPKGKKLTVSLSPAAPKPPAEDAILFWQTLYNKQPYEYIRLQELPLRKDKVQNFMGYKLQWWVEPQSKISLFNIESGYDLPQLNRINPILQGQLWQGVIDYYNCMLSASRYGGEYTQTVTPGLLSPSIVSVNIFVSYDCGGAHPDFGNTPLNIDVSTGQQLSLEDVFWLGKDKPFHYLFSDEGQAGSKNTVDFEAFSSYYKNTFAPWLVAQFSKLMPTEMKRPQNNDDCDYSDPNVWQIPSWYFTQHGILFGPSFPRVMRSCENTDWSVLPYNIIRQHPGRLNIALPQ